jgi:FkbM family methyltransferase
MIKQARQLLRKWRYHWMNRDFKPYVTTIEVNGDRYRFLIADIVGKQWYEDPSPREDPELRFIQQRVLQPGQHVIECGAHHGMFALVFAKAVGPNGSVTAIEASPASAETCRRNVELNGFSNIDVLGCAVSDRPGQLSTTGDSNLEVIQGTHGLHVVDAVTLDSIVSTPPDVIKIDIEGFEVQALRGMRETIERHHPHLLIEVHTDLLPHYGVGVADVLAFVDPAHYELYIQWDDAEAPVPYDRRQPITKRVHLFALRKPTLH